MIPASLPPETMARVFEIRHGEGYILPWWKVAIIAKSEGINFHEETLAKYYRRAVDKGLALWNIDPRPITAKELAVIRNMADDVVCRDTGWHTIKRKLQVRTKAAAVAKAIRLGYID